ncbi:MAG TPA: hypothetical protein VF749_05740 [Candidatus Acidoferrum sp.]
MKYSQQDITQVRAKLGFSTLIVLPESEEILDFTTGDKEFWIVNGAHILASGIKRTLWSKNSNRLK